MEKMKSLVKYQMHIKNAMASATPIKHLNRPEQYKAYLAKELADVAAKIEAMKLEGDKK
jgi:hypothetical protein